MPRGSAQEGGLGAVQAGSKPGAGPNRQRRHFASQLETTSSLMSGTSQWFQPEGGPLIH